MLNVLPHSVLKKIIKHLKTWWSFAQMASTCHHTARVARSIRPSWVTKDKKSNDPTKNRFKRHTYTIKLHELEEKQKPLELKQLEEDFFETTKYEAGIPYDPLKPIFAKLNEPPLDHGDLVDFEGVRAWSLMFYDAPSGLLIHPDKEEDENGYCMCPQAWSSVFHNGARYYSKTYYEYIFVPTNSLFVEMQLVRMGGYVGDPEEDIPQDLVPKQKFDGKLYVLMRDFDYVIERCYWVIVKLWIGGTFVGHYATSRCNISDDDKKNVHIWWSDFLKK